MSATWSASACRRCSSPTPPATSRTRASTSSSSSCPIRAMRSPRWSAAPWTSSTTRSPTPSWRPRRRRADPHHRRQRRRRAVHRRAEGERHQEHGRLAAAKGKGLKVGTIRFNTFELTLYRELVRTTSPTATTTSSGSTTRCRWRPRSRRRRSMSSPMSSRSRPGWSTSSAACRSPAASTPGGRTGPTA